MVITVLLIKTRCVGRHHNDSVTFCRLVICVAVMFCNPQERPQNAIDELLADKNETTRHSECYTTEQGAAARGWLV